MIGTARRLDATVVLATLALAGCGGQQGRDQRGAPPTSQGQREEFVTPADVITAVAPLPGGDLLYAERTTGRVRELDAQRRLLPRPLTRVPVSTDGQRGLLGLVVDRRRRVFAAWTDPGQTIVVGQVSPGARRIVWRGPQSRRLGNGGHLALAPDGSLVLGLGDLDGPSSGKLVALDPAGPPGQSPRLISSGWNNPFAFAYTPSGQLWVADNSPDTRPERLARGDLGERPSHVTALPRDTAPSGLAAPSDGQLVVCGYRSHALLDFAIDARGRAVARRRRLAGDCVLGVVALSRSRLAYARRRSLRFVSLGAR